MRQDCLRNKYKDGSPIIAKGNIKKCSKLPRKRIGGSATLKKSCAFDLMSILINRTRVKPKKHPSKLKIKMRKNQVQIRPDPCLLRMTAPIREKFKIKIHIRKTLLPIRHRLREGNWTMSL